MINDDSTGSLLSSALASDAAGSQARKRKATSKHGDGYSLGKSYDSKASLTERDEQDENQPNSVSGATKKDSHPGKKHKAPLEVSQENTLRNYLFASRESPIKAKATDQLTPSKHTDKEKQLPHGSQTAPVVPKTVLSEVSIKVNNMLNQSTMPDDKKKQFHSIHTALSNNATCGRAETDYERCPNTVKSGGNKKTQNQLNFTGESTTSKKLGNESDPTNASSANEKSTSTSSRKNSTGGKLQHSGGAKSITQSQSALAAPRSSLQPTVETLHQHAGDNGDAESRDSKLDLKGSDKTTRSVYEWFKPCPKPTAALQSKGQSETKSNQDVKVEILLSISAKEIPDTRECTQPDPENTTQSQSVQSSDGGLRNDQGLETGNSFKQTLGEIEDGTSMSLEKTPSSKGRRRLFRKSELLALSKPTPKVDEPAIPASIEQTQIDAGETPDAIPTEEEQHGSESHEQSLGPEPVEPTASQLFMKSFFKRPRPATEVGSQSEQPEQSVKDMTFDNTKSTAADDTLGTEPMRPPVKTYSTRQKKPERRQKWGRKKKQTSFSDSEKSVSDTGSGSDGDHSDDNMNASDDDDKPDPNQRSSMFLKFPSDRITSTPSTVKKQQESSTQLSPASYSILSGGLFNLSNTCYINSVLQVLRNITGCTEALYDIQTRICALESRQGSQLTVKSYQRVLFDSSLEIFRLLDSREGDSGAAGDGEKALYPKEVIRTLRSGDSLFNNRDQQDAAEFLLYMINQFDDILHELRDQIQNNGILSGKGAPPFEPVNWHPVNELFQISTQSVTRCLECSSVSVNTDRGIDIAVQIDEANPTLVRDLDWGISETMKMEHMQGDNQRFCERCNRKADAHVNHYFTRLPKLVILRLQRCNFKQGAVKLPNGVSCSELMNFGQWLKKDYQGPSPSYELCAIIIHRGQVITSGHYYTYIKKSVEIESTNVGPDGESSSKKTSYRWLKFNDSIVEPVSDQDIQKVLSGNVRLSESGKPTAGSSIMDSDVATPYIYVYRHKQD
ncbi:hypothetical protein BGW38_008555 [Lunasporangiospora selenospora]|uniref:USP domain-containing protein n=1 Tax=Lunasporangiospora selenospora TaxID=979761 RepID=A0A9P6KG86_9FUNG|nr:hypothetical protein BGW38_008555 [Lunasporangiospora selenospora]